MRSEAEIREALEICRDKWLAGTHPSMETMTNVLSAAFAWVLDEESEEDKDKAAALALFLAEEKSLIERARYALKANAEKAMAAAAGDGSTSEG